MIAKDASQNAVEMCNQKHGTFDSVSRKRKVAEFPHRIDRRQPKKGFRVVPCRNIPEVRPGFDYVTVTELTQNVSRHIFVTTRHISGSM